MAGTAYDTITALLEGISPLVALRIQAVMAPIEQIHNVKYVPPGSGTRAQKFPVAPTGLAYGDVTSGTIYNTQTAAPLTAITITPLARELQVDIEEADLISNPADYVNVIADAFAVAAHQKLMGLLTNLYDDGTAGGTSGTDLSYSILLNEVGKLRAAGVGGALNAVLNPMAWTQLASGLTVASYGQPAVDVVTGAQMINLFGMNIYMDSGVGNDGTDYENFLGTRTAIGIVLDLGMQPIQRIKMDATHVRLASSIGMQVGWVTKTEASWLKSDYEG